jgi:hypothetical protein
LGKYKLATTINYKDGNSTSARSSASVQTALIDIQNTITPIAEKVTSNNVRKVIAYSVDAQYYNNHDSNVIYAYNTAGIQKWSYDLTTLGITVPGYSIQTTTEGAYNVIWFVSNNGRVYAVKDNGTSAGGFWTSSIADSWVSLGHVKPVTTGPIVWNGFIYCGAGERLAKRTVSNRSIPSGWTDYDLPNDITTIPSLDNTYIYVGCKNGRLYSIREGTGGLQSQSAATGGEIHSDPFVWAGKIYTGNYQGELYRFNDTTDLTDFNMVDLDGGTNGQLSGVWVGFGLDFIWVTDKAGGNLYKRAYADLSSSATYNKAGETLYDPIEWAGKVYFGAATGGGTGKMYAVNKTDGSNVNLWPYLESDPFTSPAALDPFNNVFLSGCDNNNLYMFSLPQ